MPLSASHSVRSSEVPTSGLRAVIFNFDPSWFSVNMGTGILCILLHTMPHCFHGQLIVSTVFYILNIILYVLFLALSVARYVCYPQLWLCMVSHSTRSLFLGTVPVGLATIINATVLIAVPTYGHWAVQLVWALWWVDALLSVLTCSASP